MFIGVAVHPAVAVQPCVASIQPKQIDVEPNVDDIEGLVAQLRVAINEKLEKYESIPKVANIWEIILYLLEFIVNTIKNFINIIFITFLLIWS